MSKRLITAEQYHKLTPMGRELHDYWMKFKPEMYKGMYQKGTLLNLLQSEGERLDEMVIELIPQIGIAGAKEIAREEIYSEPPEELTEDPEEETEQDKRNREMWQLFTETMDYLQNLRQEPDEK